MLQLFRICFVISNEESALQHLEESHIIAVKMARMQNLTYYEVHRYIHSHKQKMLGKDDKNALKKGSLIVVMQY